MDMHNRKDNQEEKINKKEKKKGLLCREYIYGKLRVTLCIWHTSELIGKR